MSLYKNIHAKRKRIANGSGETMKKKGSKGAPSDADFKKAAKTAFKPCLGCTSPRTCTKAKKCRKK